jgi:hypothetical protein
MRSYGPILALFIVFFSIYSEANSCVALFEKYGVGGRPVREVRDSVERLISQAQEVTTTQQNTGDILLKVFDMIFNAPQGSTVKIYTNALRFDGIGSLLLMTSIAESKAARGLKFEFRIQDENPQSRFHDLIVKRSTNKMYFKESKDDTLGNETLIVVEGRGYSEFIRFKGELTSENLKDRDQKRPISVKYDGRNMLRASPFRNNFEVVNGRNISLEALNGLVILDSHYTAQHIYSRENTAEIQQREMTDLDGVSNRAYDLALQLYMHKNGKVPKEVYNTLGILSAVVNQN